MEKEPFMLEEVSLGWRESSGRLAGSTPPKTRQIWVSNSKPPILVPAPNGISYSECAGASCPSQPLSNMHVFEDGGRALQISAGHTTSSHIAQFTYRIGCFFCCYLDYWGGGGEKKNNSKKLMEDHLPLLSKIAQWTFHVQWLHDPWILNTRDKQERKALTFMPCLWASRSIWRA